VDWNVVPGSTKMCIRVWCQRKRVIFSRSGWPRVLISVGPLELRLFRFGSASNGLFTSMSLKLKPQWMNQLPNYISNMELHI